MRLWRFLNGGFGHVKQQGRFRCSFKPDPFKSVDGGQLDDCRHWYVGIFERGEPLTCTTAIGNVKIMADEEWEGTWQEIQQRLLDLAKSFTHQKSPYNLP